MSNIVRCRACKTARWQGDPCPNADCVRNLSEPAPRVRAARSMPGERVALQRHNTGSEWLALADLQGGPRHLGTRVYVADVDGTHFIA